MKLTVLGPGCWGLTLAQLLTPNFDEVVVWGRAQDLSAELVQTKRATRPLEIQLDEKVEFSSNLKEAIRGAHFILLVVATSGVRSVCAQLKEAGIAQNQILINTSKGLETPSLLRMSEVIKEVLPQVKPVVLSGPTLAKEVLLALPTAASVACEDIEIARRVQKALSVPSKFRLYTNPDVVGVELGGSLKNVIAIAAGFAMGKNLGHNSIGALMTRAMAEIVRLSVAMGANPSTLYGLSGMGDLIATCLSPLSRNNTVGRLLAQGKKIDDILGELGSVAEGVKTAMAVRELAKRIGVDVPVSEAIFDALYSEQDAEEILYRLMDRELKGEDSYKLHHSL